MCFAKVPSSEKNGTAAKRYNLLNSIYLMWHMRPQPGNGSNPGKTFEHTSAELARAVVQVNRKWVIRNLFRISRLKRRVYWSPTVPRHFAALKLDLCNSFLLILEQKCLSIVKKNQIIKRHTHWIIFKLYSSTDCFLVRFWGLLNKTVHFFWSWHLAETCKYVTYA